MEQIRGICEQVAQDLQADIGIEWQWQGERLVFEHAAGRGYLLPECHRVEVRVELNFLASMMRGMIEQKIHRHMDRLLG